MLDATFIIIGIVIGSCIFLLPNLIARGLPSPGAIVSVWIATGVLSFFGSLAYAELGAMIPATGGSPSPVVFTKHVLVTRENVDRVYRERDVRQC